VEIVKAPEICYSHPVHLPVIKSAVW